MKVLGKLAKQQRRGRRGWRPESQGIWIVPSLPHSLNFDLSSDICQWSAEDIKEALMFKES